MDKQPKQIYLYFLLFVSIMGSVKGMAVIQQELQDLASLHSWPQPKRKDHILQPRHMDAEFSGDSLFDEFARAVCASDCVRRKELFEAWSMALYVHDYFPNSKRICDLASGHGLLSWALLLLNSERTAVCVDVRMPKSAEKLRKAFVERWPILNERWDFVEGKMELVDPDSSTLLVGVHCCGPLSDRVLDLSIQGNASLALVPCCHTMKHLTKDQRSEIKEFNFCLADFVDTRRKQRLAEAGFDVEETEIPKVFTPKNRIILATPPVCTEEEKGEDANEYAVCWNPKGLPQFRIPIADTPKALASIRSISGRDAANLRKGHARSLCLSIALPSEPVTCERIAERANQIRDDIVAWVDYVDRKDYICKAGHRYRTFQVTYRSRGEDVLGKNEAKEVHIELCHLIPDEFKGAWVRQIPR